VGKRIQEAKVATIIIIITTNVITGTTRAYVFRRDISLKSLRRRISETPLGKRAHYARTTWRGER
jgi:hypothetical protein